jgi:flagellar biosynthesis/type III secretory pathway protein FliH
MSSRIIRPPANSTDSTEATGVQEVSEETPRITRFQFRSAGQAGNSPPPKLTEERQKPDGGVSGTPNRVSLDPLSVQEQCERMIQEAQLRVSEMEKEAYGKGFAEGQKAGMEVGESMGETLLKQYSSDLDALNRLRKELFSTSEKEVIRLSLEVARKIIKREVAIDDELILTLVKVALNRVADQTLITIRVNPRDYQSIERHRTAGIGVADNAAVSESVKLVEDPLIARGGCVIETESGTIDARVEEQLREIERGFFE